MANDMNEGGAQASAAANGTAPETTPQSTPQSAPAAAAPSAGTEAPGKGDGLASVGQIVELADQLSACADQLHERIMRDIRVYEDGSVPYRVQVAARTLLEDELVLRQRANSLYADAATHVVKSLGKSQQGVVALTSAAAEKIRKIAVIGDATSLVASLLHLAGAAATGQAIPILVALDRVHTQIRVLEAHRGPSAPA